MRVIHERTHQGCRITFFAWNNRYIIKLEEGTLEQTFKVDQFDIQNEQELLKLVDAEFVQQAMNRFLEMGRSLYEAKVRGAE
ncbi:hypothetical protein KK083_20860 [Fulvivirgaceae bacterium PWU4]|uniref:Uncharacterized protein n=1 Tax=Chryseosolibacter histidini TaxID=2782349 RepID=A0AAP2DN06_9BACT|nr:hypothetical protein [Chryseosolibacter histidini]MBT1699360.1 hypothetical protein [Chryseosolibacter histidini]